MLPACVKTEVWKELAESLSAKFKAPVVCGPAVFGKLSFFQELRNRLSDSPFSAMPGIRYVSVDIGGAPVYIGPFRTDEPHSFDEELSDAREKLPEWQDWYADAIDHSVRQAVIAGRSEYVLKDSLGRAKLLLEFSQSMVHVKDIDHALCSAVQFLAQKFKLSNVFIYAFNRQARHFDVSESAKLVEQRVIAQVKGTKAAFTIQNVATDFLLDGIKERDKLPKCVMGFPLSFNRELVGYSILYSDSLPSIDGVSEVLYELVNVLSRLSQFEKVQESAVTDSLTGLSNRAELAKNVDALIAELSSKSAPISLAMLDVDNFKNFNDTRGHLEGDRILRAMSEVMKSTAPKEALVGRYGGEEFTMVLPNYSQNDAKDALEKVRAAIEQSCELTVSVGLITCMNSSASREMLVREADRALYKAKHCGKNKVIAFLMLDRNMGVIDA